MPVSGILFPKTYILMKLHIKGKVHRNQNQYALIPVLISLFLFLCSQDGSWDSLVLKLVPGHQHKRLNEILFFLAFTDES